MSVKSKVDKSIDRYCVAVPVSLSSSLTLNNYLYEVHDVNEFSWTRNSCEETEWPQENKETILFNIRDLTI